MASLVLRCEDGSEVRLTRAAFGGRQLTPEGEEELGPVLAALALEAMTGEAVRPAGLASADLAAPLLEFCGRGALPVAAYAPRYTLAQLSACYHEARGWLGARGLAAQVEALIAFRVVRGLEDRDAVRRAFPGCGAIAAICEHAGAAGRAAPSLADLQSWARGCDVLLVVHNEGERAWVVVNEDRARASEYYLRTWTRTEDADVDDFEDCVRLFVAYDAAVPRASDRWLGMARDVSHSLLMNDEAVFDVILESCQWQRVSASAPEDEEAPWCFPPLDRIDVVIGFMGAAGPEDPAVVASAIARTPAGGPSSTALLYARNPPWRALYGGSGR